MNKQERQLMQTQLESLETKIAENNLSSLSGDYFAAAIVLTEIRDNKLYKCLKKDNKLVYRTFGSYITHFNWSRPQFSLINYLMKLYKDLIEDEVPVSKMTFSSDVAFWKEFKKIKRDFIASAVTYLYDHAEEAMYTVTDVKDMLEVNPSWKIGYDTAPSALKTVIGNIKRITDKEIDNYSLGNCENETEKEELGNEACVLNEVCNAMLNHADLPLQFAAVNLDLYTKVDKILPVAIKQKGNTVAMAEVSDAYVIGKKKFYRALTMCAGAGAVIGAGVMFLIKAFA